MAQFRVDIGLIGISGIEADGTLRDFDVREVKVAQAIIRASRQVWLAADHSKFNRPAMVEVGRLDQVDQLVHRQRTTAGLRRPAGRGRRGLHPGNRSHGRPHDNPADTPPLTTRTRRPTTLETTP